MAWKRKPTRTMPVEIDRRKGKLTQKVAHQNEPKAWEFWLRPGVLCQSTSFHCLAGYERDGLEVTLLSAFENPTTVIKEGELVTYLGRTVRDGKYTENYQFLCTRGIVLANPSGFKDARDDENGS